VEDICIYIGQIKNNKRDGIGRLIIGEPANECNIIIEG